MYEYQHLTFIAAHLSLAVVLFFSVNWIGNNTIDLGYVSTSLFEENTESVALNFLIRALSPAVFIIIVSAALVKIGLPELRIGVFMIAPYYYILRAAIIFLFNRHKLVSWRSFAWHSIIGITLAVLAYKHIIFPIRALMPDLETASNELWLAIFAFLYSVINKVNVTPDPSARKRNNFVKNNYELALKKYGDIIDSLLDNSLLKLISYSILVYEDYCRPPAIRAVEKALWWKSNRTTGIMQVSSSETLTDNESILKGIEILRASWKKYENEDSIYSKVTKTISDYNFDSDYVGRVIEVMEILAKRVDRTYLTTYNSIYEYETD